MEWLNGKNLTMLIVGVVVLFLDLVICGAWPGFGLPFLNLQIVLCSVFLIGLVLIQRGRGGGLAGAFGGMGGSSAFGTKAGDVFTWTTIVTAIVWFILSMRLVMLMNQGGPRIDLDGVGGSRQTPITGGANPPGPTGTPSSTTTAPASEGVVPKSTLPPPLVDEPAATKPAEPAKTP